MSRLSGFRKLREVAQKVWCIRVGKEVFRKFYQVKGMTELFRRKDGQHGENIG